MQEGGGQQGRLAPGPPARYRFSTTPSIAPTGRSRQNSSSNGILARRIQLPQPQLARTDGPRLPALSTLCLLPDLDLHGRWRIVGMGVLVEIPKITSDPRPRRGSEVQTAIEVIARAHERAWGAVVPATTVGDGVTVTIPFAALAVRQGTPWRRDRWLLEDHSLHLDLFGGCIGDRREQGQEQRRMK